MQTITVPAIIGTNRRNEMRLRTLPIDLQPIVFNSHGSIPETRNWQHTSAHPHRFTDRLSAHDCDMNAPAAALSQPIVSERASLGLRA
jgi:hypothetical protein